MTITSNPNDPVFYVYALLDPRKPGRYRYGKYEFDHEPFYVGKGKGDRAKAHKLRANRLVQNKIAKIEDETGKPHIVEFVIKNVPEPKAYKVEERAISSIGRRDQKRGPLLNLVNGGPGKQQMFVSSATRRRRSSSVSEYWSDLTAAEYEERTRNMKGIPKSEEHKAKLSRARVRLYSGAAGDKRRKDAAETTKRIAAQRTPKETAAIYAKQRRTRELNTWHKLFFGY